MVKDLLLKVYFTKTKEEKPFVFPNNMLTSAVVAEISQTVPGASGGATCSLELPAQGAIPSEWLHDHLPLSAYEDKLGKRVLHFKETEIKLKVKVPDGCLRNFKVDARHSVRGVVASICEKLDLTCPEEYGLISKKSQKPHDRITISFESISNEKSNLFSLGAIDRRDKAKKGITPALWDFKKDVFLDPEKALIHQDVREDDTVQLKKRYYFSDHFVDIRYPTALQFTFTQAVNDVMDGQYLIPFDDQIELSALMLQFCFGDYSEKNFKAIEPAYYLPPEYLEEKMEKKAKKRIQDIWARLCLEKLDDTHIFLRFMEKTRTLPDYGTKYFHTLQRESKKKDFKITAFGISRNFVTLVDAKSKKIKLQYPLSSVKRYAPSPKFFTIDFGDHKDEWLTVFTPHSKEILAVLLDYLRMNMEKKKTDPAATVLTTEQLQVQSANFVKEEVIKAEPQRAVVTQLFPGVRTQLLMVEPTAISTRPSFEVNTQLYAPRDPPCVANALVIQLKLPSDREMRQLDQDVSLSAATLSLQNTLDISEALLGGPMDQNEIEWRRDAITTSRQKLRIHLSFMMHALVGIFEQFSGLLGEVDAAEVGKYAQTASEQVGEFSSAVRLTAALLEEPPQIPLVSLCNDIVDTIRNIFDHLPKPGQAEYYMANQLQLLERVGSKVRTILTETRSQKIEAHFEEEVTWMGNTVVTGADSLLFNLVEKILESLKSQPVPSKIITAAVSKTFVSVKFLAMATICLAPVIYDPVCQEQIVSLANATSYQVGILENTVKVNVQNVSMKSLVEFNCNSTRELIDKLAKSVENPAILPDVVYYSQQAALGNTYEDGAKGHITALNDLLAEIAGITDPSSPHCGDPSMPVSLSKKLNDTAKSLVQDIRKKKRGIFWDQLVGDATAYTSELTNTLSLYGLALFKMDDVVPDANTTATLAALGEALNKLAEVLGEIEGMWEM